MTQLFPFLLAIVLDGATEEHLDDDDDDNTLHAAGRMVVAGTKAAVSGGGYEGTFFLFQTTFLFVCNTLNMPGVGKTFDEGYFCCVTGNARAEREREREREKERARQKRREKETKRKKECTTNGDTCATLLSREKKTKRIFSSSSEFESV